MTHHSIHHMLPLKIRCCLQHHQLQCPNAAKHFQNTCYKLELVHRTHVCPVPGKKYVKTLHSISFESTTVNCAKFVTSAVLCFFLSPQVHEVFMYDQQHSAYTSMSIRQFKLAKAEVSLSVHIPYK